MSHRGRSDPKPVPGRHSVCRMSADAVDILEEELGAHLPEGLEVLADDELLLLADLLAAAKAEQAQELEEGVEGSLDIVPRLMRGPVRKMLFG